VVSGCFAVFRTGLLRQTGGFKDRTKAEDMDYTWDLQGTEYYAYYTPHAECYPEDPYDFKTYYKQVYRWQAVLLQNIRVRNARWFWKRKAFSFMVFSYLLMNLIGPAASLLGYASLWGNLWWGLGTMYAVQGLFVWLPAFLAARRKGLSLKALTSIPAFAVIQFVNMGIFMRVLWMEWVRRKTLSTWEKGHRKVLAKD
jgi:cellulose synthase/poly-beta-1,6-N-acetylglucosamine synthase-like glycosyltransferase